MYARVTRFVGLPPERIAATLQLFEQAHLPAIRELQGYKGVQVMVDRQGGRAIATAYWETEEDLKTSDKVASEAREAAISSLDPDRPPLVESYEVLLDEQK